MALARVNAECTLRGHDDLAAYRDELHAAMPDLSYKTLEVTPVLGNKFYWKWVASGTFSRPLGLTITLTLTPTLNLTLALIRGLSAARLR